MDRRNGVALTRLDFCAVGFGTEPHLPKFLPTNPGGPTKILTQDEIFPQLVRGPCRPEPGFVPGFVNFFCKGQLQTEST
jgi:hypothetical protein